MTVDAGEAGATAAPDARPFDARCVELPWQRVGLVVVHGIGEQQPGDHVETVVRPLASAMRDQGWQVTIRVDDTPERRAEGRPVASLEVGIATIAEVGGERRIQVARTLIGIHEVHWADINEAASLGKGVRFWLWGLSAWAMPRYVWRKPDPDPDARCDPQGVLTRPWFPDGRDGPIRFTDRLQLFLTAWIFGTLAVLLRALQWIATKLFDTRPWPIVALIVNYVSAVKIYTQPRRHGAKLLESHLEPPRFTIRRRMAEALVDVALADYDRWAVLAHSQGTVIAYNGLTATGAALANYLSPARFARLPGDWLVDEANGGKPATRLVSRPSAPVDRQDRRSVDRKKLFAGFQGLLTYGSPLDKYAAIWRGTVPVHPAPQFPEGAVWINCYDTMDPVSGSLDAFTTDATSAPHPFRPVNRAVSALPVILASHLCYLDGLSGRPTPLAEATAGWLVGGKADPLATIGADRPGRSRWLGKLAWVLFLVALQVVLLAKVLPQFGYLLPEWLKTLPVIGELRALGSQGGGLGYVAIWTVFVVFAGIVGALLTEQDPEDVWVGAVSRRYKTPPPLWLVLWNKLCRLLGRKRQVGAG